MDETAVSPPRRLLITGATGFIGQNLIPPLLAAGDRFAVTLLLRERYSNGRLPPWLTPLRPQLEVVYADLRNFRLTVRAVQAAAPDAVIHLAAAGATDPFLGVETALRHNVTGAINLLRACFEKPSSVRQLIAARTPGEWSAMNVYAASKAAAWNFCQMYGRTQGWPIHGAMIFQAYGPGQPSHTLIPAAMTAALAGQDFPLSPGEQERDWIYAADVAAGLIAMLDADLPPGTTVELGAGVAATVADVVRQIYALVDRGGRPRIGALPQRPGEAMRQVADAARTKELLNWETAVSLPAGLVTLLSHFSS